MKISMKPIIILWISCVTLFGGGKVLYFTNGITNEDSTATTELYLNSNEDTRGFQVDIKYDTTFVSYDTIIVSEYLDGFTLSVNEPVKGLIKVLAISFSGQTIKPGSQPIAKIKFKIIDLANFKHTKLSISNPVLSHSNGLSLKPYIYPGYILSPDQSFLTVIRGKSSWYFNLKNAIDFAAMQFTFNYDTNIVTIDTIVGLFRLGFLNFAWNEPQRGRIKIVINNNNNSLLKIGSGPITQLFFVDKDSGNSINDFSFSEAFGVNSIGIISKILPLNSYHINLPPVIGSNGIPIEFALHQNYPNPFNPTTTLRFYLSKVSDATVTIYNVLGQSVKIFIINDTPPGLHSITWNATNDYGYPVSAGVYLYQLRVNNFTETKKMVLLK